MQTQSLSLEFWMTALWDTKTPRKKAGIPWKKNQTVRITCFCDSRCFSWENSPAFFTWLLWMLLSQLSWPAVLIINTSEFKAASQAIAGEAQPAPAWKRPSLPHVKLRLLNIFQLGLFCTRSNLLLQCRLPVAHILPVCPARSLYAPGRWEMQREGSVPQAARALLRFCKGLQGTGKHCRAGIRANGPSAGSVSCQKSKPQSSQFRHAELFGAHSDAIEAWPVQEKWVS